MDLREAAKWGHIEHFKKIDSYSTIAFIFIMYYFEFPNGVTAKVTKAIPKRPNGKIFYTVTKGVPNTPIWEESSIMTDWGTKHPKEGIHKLLKDIRDGRT